MTYEPMTANQIRELRDQTLAWKLTHGEPPDDPHTMASQIIGLANTALHALGELEEDR